MKNSKLVLFSFLFSFVILGVFSGYKFFIGNNEKNINWFFNLSLPNNLDEIKKIEDLRGENFTILNFWATWCVPCIEEMPMLSEFHKAQKSKGISVIALAIDSKKSVTSFLKKGSFNQNILIAGTQGTDLIKDLGNKKNALPFTLLIDKESKILKTKLGKISEDELLYWIDSEKN